ncbi:YlbL family protein [Corynebacterium tapiri]|uniref:YlbL family protein n=1 Tax=Corynebacterium tapiri TaxID=1448266 RepID=UPI001FE4B650|nr:PDZ domain-containing protein [Corynebacterium tapiri]
MTDPKNEESATASRALGSPRLSTLAFGAIPVVALTVLATVPKIPFTDISLTVPYAAEGPGPVFDTLSEVDGQPVVSIDGTQVDQTSGELNMTTVSVRTQMTLAQALARWATTDDTIVPIEQVIPPNHSPEDIEEQNKAAFTRSESAATIAALNHLGRPVKVTVAELVEDSPAQGVLAPEDVITSVDAQPVSTPGQVQELVRAKKPGDSVALGIRRGETDRTVELELAESPKNKSVPMLGILMISTPADGVSVEYNLQDVGGPSAGMMFSLAVIDKLSPGELNGGHNVAGTGTISENGEIGPIGGIQHKVTAAHGEGAELFLAPKANCQEALAGNHGDMAIASVETLDDSIHAMEAFSSGKDFPRCS